MEQQILMRHKINLASLFLSSVSFILLTLILLGIVYYHYWSMAHICPIFDGNNCVARVSNVGLLLARGEFGGVLVKLQNDWNNFFSIIYFSFFSAIIGPGRSAWGWAWAFALAGLLFWQLYLLKNTMRWPWIILTFLLMLICSPALSQTGGFLDQRFDLLPLLFFVAVATSIYSKRLILAFFFSITAIYAKGPAVPVFFIIWLSAFVTNVITLKQVFIECNNNRRSIIICFALLVIYKIWFLQTVVSYNLIAIQSHSLSQAIQQFILSSGRNIVISHFFYIKSLYFRSPFFFVLLALSIIILYQKNNTQRKMIWWGLLNFILTYLLFSAHPVHARVLDVWFLPSIWLLAFSVVSTIDKKYFLYTILLIAISIRLFFYADTIVNSGIDKKPTYQQNYHLMQQQAHSIANVLKQQPHLTKKVIRLLTNFVYTPEPDILFSYDTYRVLIFEALGKNSPILEGWELGTFSDNWIAELDRPIKEELLLAMIVTNGKDKIHFRFKANQIAYEYMKNVNSACKLSTILGMNVPSMGVFNFYLTNGGLKTCVAT